MSIVVDAARPALSDVERALTVFTQPTPRYPADYNAGAVFSIKQSVVETHVTARADVTPWAAVNNTANAAAPMIDYSLFWNNKIAGTDRPA